MRVVTATPMFSMAWPSEVPSNAVIILVGRKPNRFGKTKCRGNKECQRPQTWHFARVKRRPNGRGSIIAAEGRDLRQHYQRPLAHRASGITPATVL